MAEKIVQTAGKDSLGSFAPDIARYNENKTRYLIQFKAA